MTVKFSRGLWSGGEASCFGWLVGWLVGWCFGSAGSQLQCVGSAAFLVACRTFIGGMQTLSCGMWDLVP